MQITLMRNEIILEPHGGLANRMRVIASGIWLSNILQKKIKLIWNLNADLNCPFEELFEPIENIKIVEKKIRYRFFRSVKQENIFKQIIRRFVKVLISSNYIIIEDAGISKIKAGEIDILTLSKAYRTLYINTCEEFGNITDEFKRLVPKPDIQKRIHERCKKFNQKTIGVHIRRTDHIMAINQSPTELFIRRIKADQKNDTEVNYFLSTDDPETEQQLKFEFGHKILINEKDFSRKSMRGIQDALIDMYCLANTKKIYGSCGSTFSALASRINEIRIEIVQKQENA